MRRTRRWCNRMERGVEIASFDDLLCAARAQPEPQKLLFVFAGATLPEECTPGQRAEFEAGRGGALEPLMSVDKDPAELRSFEALVEESHRHAQDWVVVFVAGLAGRDGRAPTADLAGQALERMIASVKGGQIGAFMPFDRQGVPLLFEAQ